MPALLSACAAILVAAAALIQPAAASPARHIVPRPTRAVCSAPRPGYAACLSRVVAGIHPTASSAYGPADLRQAYQLPAAPPADAPGQLVAVVDAYGTATLETDLATYDARYGLPACSIASGCLQIVDEHGGANLPAVDPGWELETSLDVETIHGLCPTCRILLVQAAAPSLADLATAVDTAARMGATEISNSYGGSEDPGQTASDASYDHPGIAITASSGDSGYGVEYPAAAPGVVAVGGTSLTLTSGSNYGYELAWNGSGSGCSAYESARPWQTNRADWNRTGCASSRGVADVSADADPNTGVAVYDSTPDGSTAGWMQVGGTSLSAPIIASVYALAGGVAPGVDAASVPYGHAGMLHDVTSGSNGQCQSSMCKAGPGYDGPTGLGSVNGIAAFQRGSTSPSPTPTTSPTSVPPPPPTATPIPPTVVPSPTPTKGPGQCRQWSEPSYGVGMFNGKRRHYELRLCLWWMSGR